MASDVATYPSMEGRASDPIVVRDEDTVMAGWERGLTIMVGDLCSMENRLQKIVGLEWK